jgi:hypothetical protein
MRIIDVFYQLSYFLNLNNINGNIQGWREYSTRCPPVFLTYVGAGPWPAFAGVGPFAPAIGLALGTHGLRTYGVCYARVLYGDGPLYQSVHRGQPRAAIGGCVRTT